MTSPTSWTVIEAGGPVTVQDAGRPGLAHLGVPRGGWLDPPAARLANRLVGNDDAAAVLEVTLGGLVLRAGGARWVAVTGAACSVTVNGVPRSHGSAERVPDGGVLQVGPATSGVRCYVAIGGGVAVDPVLGSRSTDTLAGVGPPRPGPGSVLPIGEPTGVPVGVDVPARVVAGPLRVDPGPRSSWFGDDALDRLCAGSYVVAGHSDRVGLRLDGPPLERVGARRSVELASEGLVLGAVQVPPDGQPVVMLADHPTTGGYPVVAVVRAEDVARCAQLRPGESVSLRRA